MGAKDRRRWPRYGRGGQRAAKAAAGGGAATKEEPSPAETALAGGKPGEFGPSPAAVRFPDGERRTSGRPRSVFGRELSNQELASLDGAPAGSTVSCDGLMAAPQHSVVSTPPSRPPAGRSRQDVQRRHRYTQRHLQDQGERRRLRLGDGRPPDGAGRRSSGPSGSTPTRPAAATMSATRCGPSSATTVRSAPASGTSSAAPANSPRACVTPPRSATSTSRRKGSRGGTGRGRMNMTFDLSRGATP